jgi:RNA polymerase sigma-70 factor (ECF subfamily)
MRRKEHGAAADLYDTYSRLVFSVVLRIVQSRETAEDLVQEVFLRVWNRADQFDPARGGLSAWILTVARNLSIDYTRSAAGKARLVETSLPDRETFEATGFFTDPLQIDRARRVRAALDALEERQRQVILLAYFEGLSQTEMATRLGQPLGTVKTWTRSALQTLREQLAEVAA